MKLPENTYLYKSDKDKLKEAWSGAARKLSLEYGVYIEVYTNEDPNDNITRIYFRFADHEFESLKTLRKAIRNKAFV